MKARDYFKIGDRVKMTAAAIEQGLDRSRRGERVTTGVVVGFRDSDPECLLVVKDGQVTVYSWAASYWTQLKQEPPK